MKFLSRILLLIMLCSVFILPAAFSYAQEKVEDLKPYIITVDQAQDGMSLWQLLVAGGSLMFVLGALSIVGGAIVIYDFKNLKASKLCPQKFAEQIFTFLQERKFAEAKRLSAPKDHIFARIASAGLEKKDRGQVWTREAIELAARKEISGIWQNLSYLADVAAIAPLVGLLGTVIGMIQAFNVVVLQTGFVKPIMLAGGVSKAMITTAAGLSVAVPILLFYSYFRGRVHEITNEIETFSTDLIKMLE